jgi:DNA mismatch repair protein MSH6
VAKVSQIKDPTNTSKGEKRKLDLVVTPGTTSEPSILPSQSNYLLTIKEGISIETGKTKYAICLVEASLGEYAICEFEDDKYYNSLTALLLRVKPIEIVYENTVIDKNILKLFKRHCPDAILVPANPGSDFWEAGKARKYIEKSKYFGEKLASYPSILQTSWENDLILSCIGATLCYLIKLNILREDGSDLVCQNMSHFDIHGSNTTLILDSVTLRNLEVLENRYRKPEGSLLWLLDHTHTKFGKRLLRKWISFPLRNPAQINERLDAVQDLIQLISIKEFDVQVIKALKSLPDLERDIARLFSGKSSLKLFMSVLTGFQSVQVFF